MFESWHFPLSECLLLSTLDITAVLPGLLVSCYSRCHWFSCLEHQDGGCLCNVQDVLSHRLCHCRGSGRGEPGCWAPVPCLVLLGSWAPSLQGGCGGPESWVPPQLVRQGHRPTASAAQLSVTMGASVVWSRESFVLPPLFLLGSLELWAQPLWQGNWACRYCLHCPPGSDSSMCSSPHNFRCTDMENTLPSWCVGQKHLCWVVDVLLVVC